MSQLTAEQSDKGLDKYGRRRLFQVFAMVVIYGLCLFVPAGSLQWWNAWVYLGLFLLSILTAGLYVARTHPAIINERGRPSESTKPFDKKFARIYMPLGLAALVLAGLDFRFGWSEVPLWLMMVGYIGILPGMFMPYWVMYVNAYAATTVRVETDRGHQVITDGPYRYVHHPMYSTALLSQLFFPLAMGTLSVYVLVPFLMGIMIWRTANEDLTLREELPGYIDYAQNTRFRLMPGVW
ncbi:MAG: isoprenylcysteine carboxylmethyltransferase family protein [Chloroflexota bacterium]